MRATNVDFGQIFVVYVFGYDGFEPFLGEMQGLVLGFILGLFDVQSNLYFAGMTELFEHLKDDGVQFLNGLQGAVYFE